jgi:hypothetical protein
VHFNENIAKLEMESFSGKNSEAKHNKNLQFRNKIPKKNERENSTPSRLNIDHMESKNNTSVEQYRNFINVSHDCYDSSYMHKQRASSISSSNISLASESTSSIGLIGWSYQQTRDGKLYNMTKDTEWRQLYKSRYVNERVESELTEFKDEIEKKFKSSKCKAFKFPRNLGKIWDLLFWNRGLPDLIIVLERNTLIEKSSSGTRNDQSVSNANNSYLQSNDNPILLSKNFVFNYNNESKENKKISRKNIDFIQNKKNADLPPRMNAMKTIDEETKHKLSKSVPRSGTHSKSRKAKHKRQITQFKFDQNDNSCDRAKYLAKTNSSLTMTSHSS